MAILVVAGQPHSLGEQLGWITGSLDLPGSGRRSTITGLGVGLGIGLGVGDSSRY